MEVSRKERAFVILAENNVAVALLIHRALCRALPVEQGCPRVRAGFKRNSHDSRSRVVWESAAVTRLVNALLSVSRR